MSEREHLVRLAPLDRRGHEHYVERREGKDYQTLLENDVRYWRLLERRPDGLWVGMWRRADGTPA